MLEKQPLVVAVGIGRRFGDGTTATEALKSATCSIYPGDQIALVGPSGSGKSTLLHLLGGLDAPSAGAVDWPALGPRDGLRPGKIVDVFQGPSLLTPLSVIENTRLPLLLAGFDKGTADYHALDSLHRFGVDHLRDKLPEEISGGQAQRVAIARAVAIGPRLVLADEPTGQLDQATAGTVLDSLLRALTDIGAAIVVSTHDPLVAARFSTVWSMSSGRLTTSQISAHDVVVSIGASSCL